MNVIVIGQKKFVGPGSWEQITARHYLQLLNWRVRCDGAPAGRFILLQLWYGIRYRDMRLLDDDQRSALLSVLDFIDTRPDRWILPKLRVKARHYIGPGDSLDFLSFGEFMRAQVAREKYQATQLAGHLGELVAALYRPKAFFWQSSGEARRQAFNINKYTEQSLAMLGLPETVLKGVLINYDGCIERFPQRYPHLYSGSGEGSDGTWLDVGLSLARQTGALGTFVELERTNLELVLTTLDAIMKEAAELKRKLESSGGSH